MAAATAGPAHAAQPLLTEDPGTQGEGRFQLALAVDRTRDQPPRQTVREVLSDALAHRGRGRPADRTAACSTPRST